MSVTRILLSALALLIMTSFAAGQRRQREIKPGSPIKSLAFEHAFGTNAPDASQVSIPELRGRVLILEYWATW